MAEAADLWLDLEEERDDLRQELQFVLTALKKLDYDFTDFNRRLLTDTSPATAATNSRIRRRVQNFQEKLNDIKKKETPPPPPPPPPPQVTLPARAQLPPAPTAANNIATAIEHSWGPFRMFANITEGRYRRAELNARWAYRVHTENPGGIKDLKWLRQNWHSISGDAPNWSDFEHKDVKNKYLCLDNIFAAARSSNINMIEIGRNLRRATSAATSLPTTGNKQQENFKRWAVRQLQVAAPDKIDSPCN